MENEFDFDLTEYNKLKELLVKYDIPFEERITPYFKHVNHYQLIYPCDGPNRKSDVVIGLGTYGSRDGLLEQMGLLPDDETIDSDVQGWLDAETVFKRWAEDFGFFVRGMNI